MSEKRSSAAPGPADAPPTKPSAHRPNWRWRTFPVFFAFSAGLLLAALLNTETDNAFEGAVQIVALLAFGYAVAHLIVTNVIVAGRAKRTMWRPTGGDDDEWEDAVVHPDETPRAR